VTIELHYLTFDFSDEDSGRGSFDALASVLPERQPALLEEIVAVLRWAEATFGPGGEEAEWDHALQATPEPPGRTTVAFTISGSAAFCEAFRAAFAEAA